MNTIFRNSCIIFRRFRTVSILNIAGLSVAFAAFFIIIIQVQYEITFDTSYKKAGQIYRVESTMVPSGASSSTNDSFTAFMARPIIEFMLPSIPRIEGYTLLHGAPADMYIQYETSVGDKNGMILPVHEVSPTFIDIFNPELITGDITTLEYPDKILIPQSLSKKMFGDSPAIGQSVYLKQKDATYTIGGVYKDFPTNSSITNDIKIGLRENTDDWTDWTFQLFIILKEDAMAEEVSIQLKESFLQSEISRYLGSDTSFRLTPIENIYYLHDISLDIAPKGNRAITYLLLCVAFLVVIIATINYINFSIALIPGRIKSINIRKVSGASTLELRITILLETTGICFLSFVFSLFLIQLFNATSLSSVLFISPDIFQHRDVVLPLFMIVPLTGFVAGIYPMIYITSFTPGFIRKNTVTNMFSNPKFSILLTAFQFTISAALIISALFMQLQNSLIYKADNILNNDRIVIITFDQDFLTNHSEALNNALTSSPLVTDVAFSEWPIGFLDYYHYTYANTPDNKEIKYFYLPISYNFPELMNLKITEGRNFMREDIQASEERVIFNQLAAQQLNIQVGDRLSNGSVVIGIMEDFRFMNLRKKIEPVALTVKNPHNGSLQVVYIKAAENAHQITEHIKSAVTACDPLYPPEIKTYRQLFEETYRKEQQTSTLITLFCLLAILISMSGILSLITFETQYCQKEIAIRKIMGATPFEILKIFNDKYFRLIIVSFFIAIPVSWIGMNNWLSQFAHRTPLYSWVFVLSLLIILFTTLLTITVQCWQIATANPVISLKDE
ncbi:MAG: ABC transporter permease [Tannerellaceae bacterium]|nr:ABC transporter permease [Tannerellaceae bacterium]